MRVTAIAVLAAALVVPSAWTASRPAGSLSIESGRGTVVIRGGGTVVGRLAKGELQIVDLSPNDQWSPRVNGIARTRLVIVRGKDVNFFIPGGRYRVSLRGEGISVSARGTGFANVKASKDGGPEVGTVAVGDNAPTPLPEETERIVFGGAGVETPSTKVLP
jgi:hypothetical protein